MSDVKKLIAEARSEEPTDWRSLAWHLADALEDTEQLRLEASREERRNAQPPVPSVSDREALVKAALKVLHPNATRNMPMALDYSHKIADAVIAAGFRRTPAPYDHPEGHVALVPLEWVLETYRDGDERGWDAEFEFLRREHSGQIDRLATSVQETGIQEPILLGSDGRVWDGHHRLCVASMLGLASVPVLLPTRSPAPQQVSTVEELEALPGGSVILDQEPCVCEKSRDDGLWLIPGTKNRYAGVNLMLPATVLYRPEGGESE